MPAIFSIYRKDYVLGNYRVIMKNVKIKIYTLRIYGERVIIDTQRVINEGIIILWIAVKRLKN